MKALEDKLNKLIYELGDKTSHSLLNSFVATFFNRRTEGNKALLIGLHNTDIIKLLLGTTAEFIIKEDAKYIICINKRRETAVHILFDTFSELNEEVRKNIEDLFQAYSTEEHYNLVSAFRNGYVPNLVIHGEKVREFLDTPHPAFRIINGNDLIKKVSIDYNWETDASDLYTSFAELYVITKNNRVLKEFVSEEDYRNKLCSMMKDAIPCIDTLNFFLLNTPDDHLCRLFDSLMTMHREKFYLDETNISLLHRVFFNLYKDSDSRFESQNALLLHCDINELAHKNEDIALYVILLDILHRDSVNGDTNKKILKYWDEYCEVVANKDTLNHLVTDLEESIRLLPELFLEAKSKTEGLINFLNNPPKKATKEDCFRLVDDFLLYIADYAIRYNDKANKDIVGFKERIESQKAEYELNKKKWYKNADSSFGKFCNSIAEDVNLIWNQTMTGLSLSDWWSQSIAKLEKAYDSYLHFVVNQSEDSNPSIKVLSSLNGQVVRYIYALKDLQDNVLKMYDAVKDSDDFIRSEFAESLLVYTSKAQDVLGEECENYSRELSNFISDNAIRVQMQDLLFGELKRIV